MPDRRRPAPVRGRYRSRRRRGVVLLVVVLVLVVLVVTRPWSAVQSAVRSVVGAPGGGSGQALDAAYFADGACMAFPPTAGDRHQTVFLDAGHGGIDPGGVGQTQAGTTIDEGALTLPVELDAMALLRADGYRVVVSRTQNSTVLRLGSQDVSGGVLSLTGAHDDVAARDICANDAGASVLVGIYFDAGSPNNAGSLTAWDDVRPFAASNQRLATLVQKDTLAAMNAAGWQIPDDGVQTDEQLGSYVAGSGGIASAAASYNHIMLIGPAAPGYFTSPSTMPGALIEPLYLTDPFEGTLAATPADQQIIARGIATGVEQYLAGASASPAGSATTGGS